MNLRRAFRNFRRAPLSLSSDAEREEQAAFQVWLLVWLLGLRVAWELGVMAADYFAR